MAEIKIRNLSTDTIARIDSMAAASGISRNEYLRRQVELLSESPALIEKDDRYERLADLALTEIRRCEDILERNEAILSKLYAALSL